MPPIRENSADAHPQCCPKGPESTNAAARTRSPLSVFDFTKRISIGHVTKKGYDQLAPYALKFARYEGFDAHGNALSDMRRKAFASGE